MTLLSWKYALVCCIYLNSTIRLYLIRTNSKKIGPSMKLFYGSTISKNKQGLLVRYKHKYTCWEAEKVFYTSNIYTGSKAESKTKYFKLGMTLTWLPGPCIFSFQTRVLWVSHLWWQKAQDEIVTWNWLLAIAALASLAMEVPKAHKAAGAATQKSQEKKVHQPLKHECNVF